METDKLADFGKILGRCLADGESKHHTLLVPIHRDGIAQAINRHRWRLTAIDNSSRDVWCEKLCWLHTSSAL